MYAGRILSEALSVHQMRPNDQITERANELLDLVRLPQSAADMLPDEFSGGTLCCPFHVRCNLGTDLCK